jgi:ATP-binding cassette subfamily B protein
MNNNKKNKGAFGGHGPGMGMGAAEKAKDFKGTLKKLFNSLSNYKYTLAIILIFAIASTIFSIVGPKILGNATTELFNGIVNKISGGSGIDFTKVGVILLKLIILYVCSTVFLYIQGILMANISQKYTYKLRRDLSLKINKMPMSFFDKKDRGEVLSIITNDIDTLSQSLNQAATQLITSVVTVIGIAFMMFSINVVITLVVLVILPISVLIMAKIMGRSQKYFKNQQEYLGHVNGRIEEMFSGYDVVKAFNAEDKILNDFEIENKKLGETGWKSQFISGLMHPLMTFIGNINYVVVAILGSYFTIKGKMSVGDIQSFISYSKNFTQPLAQIAQVSNMLQSMIAAAERVFEFLDSEEEEVSKNIVKLDNISGNVSFNHVKFGYNENQTVIKDFSVNVKSGQKVAIVGPTGAGKTTLIKLLMRFYRVNDGSILIDNKNINDLETDDLRKAFGMVLQDTWLFSGTIADNLRYGKLDATEDEITSASKAAYADHFIKTLPDGYNMILNEETDNISQGQKQLLTIARAILADPKVLILDEATSSVDTRTEILIQKAMDELMKGRTSFIIAHRLSTIKNADLILVMDEGDIVETGSHKELLDKNGFYASLYNSQFEKINN